MRKYTKGSEWRKWDLHFHTPSSYDYTDETVTNELIISKLLENNISVVAITDHHFIDVERIKDLQRIGIENEITVLPGIEFLSDARGEEPIHFIGIFSESSNIDFIWGQLKNITQIKRIEGENKRHNEVYCDLVETTKLIHELGGLVSIHAGNKSNSIENITHSLSHGAAQKTDIANEIDIYELGKESDQIGYIKSVFPTIKKIIPMIIASDNHNINNYKLKQNCWIKADPNFEGLKQIIYEPTSRVYIGENNPSHEIPKLKISSIEFKNIQKFPIIEQKIQFNGDLTCIIGGRGSGKSALLEMVSYVFNLHNCTEGSFIANFLKSGSSGEILFEYLDLAGNKIDYDSIKVGVDNSEYFPAPILYLGQNKIESLANDKSKIHELALGTVKRNSPFSDEIVELDKEIDSLVAELAAINNEIESDRIQLTIVDKERLAMEKEKILNELKLLESPKTKEILGRLSSIRIKKDAIDRIKETKDYILKQASILQEKVKPNVEIFNLGLSQLGIKENVELDFSLISEKLNEIIGKIPETEILASYQETIAQVEYELQGKTDVSVAYIESLKTRINEIDKSLELFKKNEAFLMRDIDYRFELLLELEGMYVRLEFLYSKAITEFALQNKDILKDISLEASHEFDVQKLLLELYDNVDKRKVKTFEQFFQYYFRQEGKTKFDFIKWIKDFGEDPTNYDIFYGEGLKTFEEIVYKNRNILNTKIYYQLDGSIKKPLNELSLGQKGTVILKLYLSTGNNCPIIIDQPEDHLDNDFIYSDLVTAIRNAKIKRQIIIVTHDANLVVNGDSEQVIIAEFKDGRISHELSGSLENIEIKDRVTRILEGGSLAFKQRERKYSIK